MHPVVLYFKDAENILKCKSLCFISDDLEHDTSLVHEIQRRTALYVNENHPQIKLLHYFSDGCAGQYKSFKSFLNLCYHKTDFGIDAIWSFFATSHGKSPCDGVGGTVKRKMMRASLQRPCNDQILTFEAVKNFCETSIKGITFIAIDKNDMEKVREDLNERYKLGQTVEGTRSLHHFEPESTSVVKAKYLSAEESFSVTHSFDISEEEVFSNLISSLKPNDYVTCQYDNFWWLALVSTINHDEKDVTCKFMHPHGHTETFYWPARDDIAHVPFSRILMKVSAPKFKSSSGRQYDLSKTELQSTVNAFKIVCV